MIKTSRMKSTVKIVKMDFVDIYPHVLEENFNEGFNLISSVATENCIIYTFAKMNEIKWPECVENGDLIYSRTNPAEVCPILNCNPNILGEMGFVYIIQHSDGIRESIPTSELRLYCLHDDAEGFASRKRTEEQVKAAHEEWR